MYTKVDKPTTPTYTNVNAVGKEQYDQIDIEYDESTIFYDGVNENAYTKLAKPTSTTYTKVAKPT